jgi:glucose/arabinose dehydrogenase
MLYAIVGDGHDASNAQDLSDNDRGKILRMTPNGRIPSTNPRGSRIFAYGIRNSFGFAFDPTTDRLWETENGPECNDELNLIRAGANYGWGPRGTCSGTAPRDTNQDGPNPVLPKLFFAGPIGITGVAFCDGCGLGAASEGGAFFGAVNGGDIRRVTFDATRSKVRTSSVVLRHSSGTISFEVGPGGRIYFSDFGGIYRLTGA